MSSGSARVAALRFGPPPAARVAALRFGPSPAQMSTASAPPAPSASSVSSASSTSFTRSTPRSSSCYVPAEIRASRRAARALEVSNPESGPSIFEHVIGLIKQMKACTDMEFAGLRASLPEHFRHMAEIMRQI